MTNLTHTTKTLKLSEIDRKWHLIDVRGKILGRTVSEISQLLIGKGKSNFSPNMDNGDFVVVVNAKDIEVTGRKVEQKIYTRYSGYPGGLKKLNFDKLMQKDPRKVIQNAVSGMLPKNKHRKLRMTRLYVFADDKHPYGDKI